MSSGKTTGMSQRIIDRSYVGEVLQRIYESDLQVKITLITDGGYFYLEKDGKKLPLHGTNVEEAVTDLAVQLIKQFPSSRFSEWWRDTFRSEQRSNMN